MAKIVKYCKSCDESFTEKFGFCPICGETLGAFEMKPVKNAASDPIETPAADTRRDGIVPSESPQSEPAAAALPDAVPETKVFGNQPEPTPEKPELELDLGDTFEASAEEAARVDETAPEPISSNVSHEPDIEVVYDDFRARPSETFAGPREHFEVTVLTEKNVKQRNVLLLGSMFLMVSLCVGVVIASIFNHPLLVGPIGEGDLVAFVPIVDDAVMKMEEQDKKDDDKAEGGGGGGGRNEKTPTSEGRLATQTDKPLIAPSYTIPQKDFELKQPIASNEGLKEREQTSEPYGDPYSKYKLGSDGPGGNRGQGDGDGDGQGSDRGGGDGPGKDRGTGGGLTGDGGRRGNNPSSGSTTTSGPTTRVKFIDKPQPKYTDAARINNIQGSVTLRITFLSNGQIGGISPVKGLPHGLTEQAIAAARRIRFEPALSNGRPQSVTISVQYVFTIY